MRNDGKTHDRTRGKYTLSVAADLVATHPRSLMNYEDIGLLRPKRTAGNRRQYSDRDLDRVEAIQILTGLGYRLIAVPEAFEMILALHKARAPIPQDLKEIPELLR